MKAIIDKKKLMQALSHLHGVVEKRNTIPILANVLIEAKDNSISLAATDMEIAEVQKVTCEVDQDGIITTPAHVLHDIVRKLPENARIELESFEGKKLDIKTDKISFSLMCLNPKDYPDIHSGDFPNGFEIEAERLSRLIDKTLFSVSTEETRYYLNGIYIHAVKEDSNEKFRVVATDGHRLSRLSTELPLNANDLQGVIIPRKTVTELRKIIDSKQNIVKIQISKNKIRFIIDNITLTSKLLDGAFPDYEKVIPNNNKKELIIDNKEFIDAVDRVSTLSSDRTRAIKFELKNKSLTISAENPDQGSAKEHINVHYTGDDLEIGFNSRYLLDIAKQISGAQIKFLLSDKLSPTLIFDDDDKQALYLLMPMHI
ncbi:MAG: DNA polymerase III subunit beta [Rickettsiales bacterium]|nr:DNA polymerase III subunit beta [Rickettsiales bacterium]OUV78393.1 MAG: DNA polymerase III subunit beta [Rickettsiales bacterium TMED131]|tara:strand:- start:1664 stop:2779 length:1116 start_codon:yes stop_codon:yes gene_type:complete